MTFSEFEPLNEALLQLEFMGDTVSYAAQGVLGFTEGFTKYRDIDDTGERAGMCSTNKKDTENVREMY